MTSTGVLWPLGYTLELLGLFGLAMDFLRVGELVTPLLSRALSRSCRRPKPAPHIIPLPYLFSLFPMLFLLFPLAVTQSGEPGMKAASNSNDGSGATTSLCPRGDDKIALGAEAP